MADYNKNQPDYCNSAYRDMERPRTIVGDVCAGTLKLREKGPEYLPLEPAEKSEHYQYRKMRAILFNGTDRTLHGLVGMVFRKEPKLGEDVPEIIRGREAADGQTTVEGHWENIDLAGTHGAVFCKEIFTDAMRDGHAAILVDMPPQLEPGATLADDRAQNRRPYWVAYCAEQIINWRTEVVNGKTVLVLVVLKECTQEPDGDYGEKKVTRYRVLRPGSWELYREINEGIQKTIVFEDSGQTSLSEIPLAIVYSRKLGILKSQPPLLDLATTNVAHYQKYNDFSIYMHLASRPILCRKGSDNKPIAEIGPYTIFDVGPDGDVWFAETTGAALEAASEDIKDLEQRMSILGLSLLIKQTGGPITATEERNDQMEESSDLSSAARSLQDAIELSLKFHNQYLDASATTGGSVELGAALDELILTPEEMMVWLNAVAAGDYSRETMWDVFGRAGKNPPDFDKKVEQERIKKQQKEKMEMSAALMGEFETGGREREDAE